MVDLGFRVYIFDNTPNGAERRRIMFDSQSISYSTAGKNVGLGYSLATLCATAHAQGYPRLLFLDQDTGISPQTLEFIQAFALNLQPPAQNQYAALVFSGQLSATEHSVQEVRLAISSGSLFNLSALQQIGWHNEKYFVDCVDYEFCVRARRFGFKIGLINNTPDFDHVTEQPDEAINFLGKLLLVRRYSTKRIKDSLGAYLKLIVGGFFHNPPSDTYALVRSMGLYIFGQLISRIVKGK